MGLTYGIDIHGTLAARQPDGRQEPSTLFPLLKPLMKAWVEQGEFVYIISGPTRDVIKAELEDLGLERGVHFNEVISVVDYLRFVAEVPMEERTPGHWWTLPGQEQLWDDAKGKLAQLHNIDIVVDDQIEYAPGMPGYTSFVHVTAELLHPDLDQFQAAAGKLLENG